MERDDLVCARLLDRFADGDLVRHPLRRVRVPVDERDAVLKSECRHLRRIHHGHHDAIVTNEFLCDSLRKGQRVRARTINGGIDHRDDGEVALAITLADIDVSRSGGEEQPLANGKPRIVQHQRKCRIAVARRLVCFVEDADIERRQHADPLGDNLRGVIRREHDTHAARGGAIEKAADNGRIGIDRKRHLCWTQVDRVVPGDGVFVGADAEILEPITPLRLLAPLAKELLEQEQGRDEDEDGRGVLLFGCPQRDEGLACGARHHDYCPCVRGQ
jgi:hypothetical protein